MTHDRKLSKAEKAKLKQKKDALAKKLKYGIREREFFQAKVTPKPKDDKSLEKAKAKLNAKLDFRSGKNIRKKLTQEEVAKLRQQESKKATAIKSKAEAAVKALEEMDKPASAPTKESSTPPIDIAADQGSGTAVVHEAPPAKPTAEEVFSTDKGKPSSDIEKDQQSSDILSAVNYGRRNPKTASTSGTIDTSEMPASLAAKFNPDKSKATEPSKTRKQEATSEKRLEKNYEDFKSRLTNFEDKFKAFDEMLSKNPSKTTLSRIEGSCNEVIQKMKDAFNPTLLPTRAMTESSKQVEAIFEKAQKLIDKADKKLADIVHKEKAAAQKPDKPTAAEEIRPSKRPKPGG